MTNASRPVLKLVKRQSETAVGQDESRLVVGLFDVLLPSRQFTVRHKVAEVGQVSLTTEFVLRLLFSVDGMAETEIAEFFGFNATELAFVINEVEARSYVAREKGQVWLTDAGYALFKDADKPQIFEVIQRKEKVGFDLLALAPCERTNLSEFERALPELEVREPELVANASKLVRDSFRRYFAEIVGRKERDPTIGVRRTLYSVDDVVAGDRFFSVIPVLATTTRSRPDEIEPSFDAWRSGHELEDRNAVVHSIASFLDELRAVRTGEAENAYQVLAELAPEYLEVYRSKSEFNSLRFFRETAARVGDVRKDRQTVGTIGPLFSPDNSRRLLEALMYTGNSRGEQDNCIWILPTDMHWGASRALGTLINKVGDEGLGASRPGDQESAARVLALTCGQPSRHIRKAFQKILVRADNGAVPAQLEMLLVPRRAVGVVVHAPLSSHGFSVPLGLISFDTKVVRRAHEYIANQLPQYLDVAGSENRFDLRKQVEWESRPSESAES